MSSKLPSRDTVYAQFVYSNVLSTLAVGQGAYTVDELARMVGLKPTHNFRRRVKALVQSGQLKAEPVFSPSGGLMALYSLPVIETTMEQPSW